MSCAGWVPRLATQGAGLEPVPSVGMDTAQAQRHTPRKVGRRPRPNVVERAGCCATNGLPTARNGLGGSMSTLSITMRSDGSGTVQVDPIGEIDSDNCHQLRDEVGA